MRFNPLAQSYFIPCVVEWLLQNVDNRLTKIVQVEMLNTMNHRRYLAAKWITVHNIDNHMSSSNHTKSKTTNCTACNDCTYLCVHAGTTRKSKWQQLNYHIVQLINTCRSRINRCLLNQVPGQAGRTGSRASRTSSRASRTSSRAKPYQCRANYHKNFIFCN